MTRPHPFSRRTDWELKTNRFSETLKNLRASGVQVLDLTQSNPTKCSFHYLLEDFVSDLSDENNTRYDPAPKGSLLAREAVSRYYEDKGYAVMPERIFLTASTSEAYSFLFRLLADSGETVLFPKPSYPLFAFLGDLNDVNVEYYPLTYDGHWGIDCPHLEKCLTPGTRAVVLVNPNNPTGSCVTADELRHINTVCQAHPAALICDEVFGDFPLNHDNKFISLVGNRDVLTFTLGGLSKTLGLPQMKLSWITISGPEDLAAEAADRLEVIADTYLSVNTPVQHALPRWLAQRPEIQNEINTRIRGNYKVLANCVSKADGCTLLEAQAGWYAVVRIPETMAEEEWILTFLNEDRVAVHPGYFFEFPDEAYIIVSLLPELETFREGIERILSRIGKASAAAGTDIQSY